MPRLSMRTLILSVWMSLLAVGTLPALDLPGKIELSLTSGAEDIQRFRDYAVNLSSSEWPELAALGDLAFSMAQALEVGDEEGFVADQAVFNFRKNRFSEEIRVEMLRIQLGAQCNCSQPIEKCGGGGGNPGSCTSNSYCMTYCGPPLGGSCIDGSCVCD